MSDGQVDVEVLEICASRILLELSAIYFLLVLNVFLPTERSVSFLSLIIVKFCQALERSFLSSRASLP